MEKDQRGFWRNPAHTNGYAACDRCEAGTQGNNNPIDHSTFQNGEITLCAVHYAIMMETYPVICCNKTFASQRNADLHEAEHNMERMARKNSGFSKTRGGL